MMASGATDVESITSAEGCANFRADPETSWPSQPSRSSTPSTSSSPGRSTGGTLRVRRRRHHHDGWRHGEPRPHRHQCNDLDSTNACAVRLPGRMAATSRSAHRRVPSCIPTPSCAAVPLSAAEPWSRIRSSWSRCCRRGRSRPISPASAGPTRRSTTLQAILFVAADERARRACRARCRRDLAVAPYHRPRGRWSRSMP